MRLLIFVFEDSSKECSCYLVPISYNQDTVNTVNTISVMPLMTAPVFPVPEDPVIDAKTAS